MRLISCSSGDTKRFARELAKKLRGGQILALVGDLGSGKTTFVKGLAEGLKVKQTIHSPTFVLMRIFEIPKKQKLQATSYRQDIPKGDKLRALIHIDAYRLKDETELLEIGVLDYLGQPGTLTVIEWADRTKSLLKKFDRKTIWINFDYGKKEGERIIYIKLKRFIRKN